MSWAVEIESRVSAARMFDAAIMDWHNLGPKIAPEVLVSGTEDGSMRQLNFTSEMPFSYLKERMDFVDHETFECESTITEGGLLGAKLKSVSIYYKIVKATTGDGCVIKVVTSSNSLPGIELDVAAEELIGKAKDGFVKLFKTVEAYLLENPDKYCVLPSSTTPSDSLDGDEDELLSGDVGDGDSHPRDFYGNQVNGVVYGNVNQGAVKPPGKSKKPNKPKVVSKPGWRVRVTIG